MKATIAAILTTRRCSPRFIQFIGRLNGRVLLVGLQRYKRGSSEEFVGKNTVNSTQLNPIYSYRACEPSYPPLRLA